MHDPKAIAANPRERGDVQTATSSATRADLHCHSSASALARLEVQRAVALPECATAPREVYELAKRRRMDFVTITDHDTIAGALEIADDPDVFVSEELTSWFPEEPQAVHVLCCGITPDDHEWLQAIGATSRPVADYLHGTRSPARSPTRSSPSPPRCRQVTAACSHNSFPSGRRATARGPELNAPAALYIETHGGIGVGGSDDHAGIDIGRTFTEARRGRAPGRVPEASQGGTCHPVRRRGKRCQVGARRAGAYSACDCCALKPMESGRPPNPAAILAIAESIIRERVGGGERAAGLGLEDVRRLLVGWLTEMELDPRLEALLRTLQIEEGGHAALALRARRIHERKLARG